MVGTMVDGEADGVYYCNDIIVGKSLYGEMAVLDDNLHIAQTNLSDASRLFYSQIDEK